MRDKKYHKNNLEFSFYRSSVGQWDGAFALFAYEGLVDMRDDPATRNSGFDQGIQLFVSADSKL